MRTLPFRYFLLILLLLSGCLFTGSEPSNNNAPNNESNNESNNAPNNTPDPELCGNGQLDPGEKCDPCGSCGGTACQPPIVSGSADDCTLECEPGPDVTTCIDDDGCCPSTCTEQDDSDCSALCGNGEVDPGETCDPCESVCPSRPCAPTTWSGDPSTCDFECIDESVPAVCCGDALCPLGQMCADMMCVDEGGCDDAADCPAEETCVNNQCQPAAPACTSSSECLPWQECELATGTCERAMDCVSAGDGIIREAWCAATEFEPGPRWTCIDGSEPSCQPATQNPLCDPARNDCYPWEACLPDPANVSGFGCAIPDNCLAAQNADTYCQFALGDVNATCAEVGLTFECIIDM